MITRVVSWARRVVQAVFGYESAPLLRLTAGLAVEPEPGPELAEALERSAAAYLRAGGVIDWRLWERLTQAERAAFGRARHVLDVEQARRTGEAGASYMGWLNVGAEVDGGEEREGAVIALAVHRLAERSRESEARRAG